MTWSHTMITERKLARRQQMVIPEFKLTKKVTVFKLPRVVVEKPREVERRRFYVLSTDIEARGHMGSCPGCVCCLRRREKRLDSESESEQLSWREKPGGKHARTESLRESESERIEKSSN